MFSSIVKMHKFIALKVSKGDAFLLQREEDNILVDGGQHGDVVGLLTQLNVGKLDICVATHADADHAGGILDLLKSPIQISELWLPADWQNVISLFLENPEQFIKELSSEVERSGKQDLSLEKYAETLKTDSEIKPEDLETTFGINVKADITDLLRSQCLKYKCPLSHGRLFCESVRFTNLILKIYSAARMRASCKIRWFQYSPMVSGHGKPGMLESLNSKEIKSSYLANKSPLLRLALSLDNRRALVFYSPENDVRNLVVFTTDSDLKSIDKTKINAATREAIITAPHHGSVSNTSVYGMFPAVNAIWVRSDHFSRRNPCADYKLKKPNHFCTRCNTRPPEQNVILDFAAKKWLRQSRICSCN